MALSTSIVLCTYNGARFLEPQWASLLAQTRPPDEIIVRDDASTDATPALLQQLRGAAEAQGVRVRVTRNPENLGYIVNFAAALGEAAGDVLFLCDQDDVWHADKLATLVAEFERRADLLLVCSDARRVDATGVNLGRSLFEVLRMTSAELRRIHAGRGFEVLLHRSMATGATVALRRGLLADALPFPDGWVHDEWLAIVAAALGGFDCVEQPLIDYRQHGGNQIGMPERSWRDKWRDLRLPRAALLETLIAHGETLARRLDPLRDKVLSDYLDRLDGELEHWRRRRAIRGVIWARVAPISREVMNGGYARYSSGWRSALRDLLRRD